MIQGWNIDNYDNNHKVLDKELIGFKAKRERYT